MRCSRCGRITRNPEQVGLYYYGPTCSARLRQKAVKVQQAELHDRQLSIFTDADVVDSVDNLSKKALDELTELSQIEGMYE